MDGLLFELVQVYTAGSTLALLPLSLPGVVGGPTMDAKVVMKKRRQVTRVLQNYKEVAEINLPLLIANKLGSEVSEVVTCL